MYDPYIILGVTPNSTDEQIKEAYRELAKKYHPDSHDDSAMRDYATGKMQEINQAYDTIVNERRSRGGSSNFNDIRRLIQQGRYDDAEVILNGIMSSGRTAEWYFLKGTIFYNRGWLDDAENCFRTATQREPSNSEYAAAYNRLNNHRNGYTGGYNTTNVNRNSGCGCSGCDVCTGLMCADCCCECMGGDLIRCC